MASLGFVGLLLAGCAPVPGAGWAPEPTAVPTGPSVPDVSPESLTCVGPLDGPLRILADSGIGAASDPESAVLGAAGLALLNIIPAQVRTLTLGGPSGTDPICAPRVVAADADDPQLRVLAAAWAALDGVPLVLATDGEQLDGSDPGGLVARLEQLDVSHVAHLGPPPPWLAASGSPAVELHGAAGPLEAVLALAEALTDRSTDPAIVLVLGDDVASQADLVAAVRSGSIPLVLPADDAAAALIAALNELIEDGLPHELRWAASSLIHARALAPFLDAVAGEQRPSRWQTPARRPGPPDDRDTAEELWLGDVRDPVAVLHAAVAATTRGGTFVAVDGDELRSGAGRTERMRMIMASPMSPLDAGTVDDRRTVVLVGALEEHTRWQLETVLTGTPLPTGGFLPLEDQRIVALYGSPGATGLGLLGQQDDAATIALAREYAAGYEDAVDGRTVVPGLDVIATVASSGPGSFGDYSRRVPIERLRTLVRLAREEGVAVLIDLQPGRTDFLTQALELEELLREPHVHLALDPEWRLGAQERHLVRIGSVSAAEVQAVADWLAQLVRDERLPQKILMVHQFTLGMFPDRDTIVIPPELIGVIHMDGQGSLAAKERTYAAIVAGTDEHWAWGWKNFTRIDRPLATPERTLARTPIPVIITYQ